MIDQVKRNTLKKLAGVGGGSVALVACAGITGIASADTRTSGDTLFSADTLVSQNPQFDDVDLADIQVHTTVSSLTNDIEIVFTNTGSEPVSITDIMPAQIHTARGKFNFDALLENGALQLRNSESIRVPLQRHQIDVLKSGGVFAQNGGSLKQKLRDTVCIVTDDVALAVVDVV